MRCVIHRRISDHNWYCSSCFTGWKLTRKQGNELDKAKQHPSTEPESQNDALLTKHIHLSSLGKTKCDSRGEDEPCSLQPDDPVRRHPKTYLWGHQKQMCYHGSVFQQHSEHLENLVLVAMACEQQFHTVTYVCKKQLQFMLSLLLILALWLLSEIFSRTSKILLTAHFSPLFTVSLQRQGV